MKAALAIYSLFALLFIVVSSCKKDKLQHTIAEGWVVDTTTQQPVPGALVQLLTKKRELFGYGFSLVDSVRSDAAGKYYLSFQADEDFSYHLQASAKKHLDQSAPTGITSGKKNKTNLALQPEAFLKIRIKRITPPGQFFAIHLLIPNNGSQPGFNKDFVDTIFTRSVKGNITNEIAWVIYDRNATQMLHNFAIYCPAHDTTTFTIEY